MIKIVVMLVGVVAFSAGLLYLILAIVLRAGGLDDLIAAGMAAGGGALVYGALRRLP